MEVTIGECFARDGLQHEEKLLRTSEKSALIGAFIDAGFRRIEATSYSNPQRIPAFADASKLLATVPRRDGVSLKATCPNPRAVERALADRAAGHGADELSFLVSATEAHSERNLNATRDQQWRAVAEMARLAGTDFELVGVVSVAFGCPFEGSVDPGRVVDDASRFADLGISLVTIGDTIGTATPRTASRLFSRLVTELPGVTAVAHFHDTRGAGIANSVAALDAGCRYLDSAFGGVGGHPVRIEYGSGQTGNVCTEDLVFLLESMGVRTSLDLDAVVRASELCERMLARPLSSRIARLTSPTAERADVAVS